MPQSITSETLLPGTAQLTRAHVKLTCTDRRLPYAEKVLTHTYAGGLMVPELTAAVGNTLAAAPVASSISKFWMPRNTHSHYYMAKQATQAVCI